MWIWIVRGGTGPESQGKGLTRSFEKKTASERERMSTHWSNPMRVLCPGGYVLRSQRVLPSRKHLGPGGTRLGEV